MESEETAPAEETPVAEETPPEQPDAPAPEEPNPNAEAMKAAEDPGPDSTEKPAHDPVAAVKAQIQEIVDTAKNSPLYKSLEKKLEELEKSS